ncbi:MAG: hypothetical protein IJ412_11170 [Oscillospiraceae bacterium]|nr:hypothetical protein [Oscillospiraceae bacterium]
MSVVNSKGEEIISQVGVNYFIKRFGVLYQWVKNNGSDSEEICADEWKSPFLFLSNEISLTYRIGWHEGGKIENLQLVVSSLVKGSMEDIEDYLREKAFCVAAMKDAKAENPQYIVDLFRFWEIFDDLDLKIESLYGNLAICYSTEIPGFMLPGNVNREIETLIDQLVYLIRQKYPDCKLHVDKPVSSTGCYIATAVYGSYDCPEVWTLRRFRDEILKNSIWGRIFIRFYYMVSPKLVEHFGKRDWFHCFWRRNLDRFVAYLKTEGFSDAAYIDKN